MYEFVFVFVRVCVRVRVCMCAHKDTRACLCMHIIIYLCENVYAHMHARVCIVCMCVQVFWCFVGIRQMF